MDYRNDVIIEQAVSEILTALGYSLEDQHIQKTPPRVRKWLELYARHSEDAGGKLLAAVFDDEHDSLVMTGPIRVNSFCAHHMLPVQGWAWVGYIPDGKVCGLSKMARVVDYYSRQLTVQERVTQQIAGAMERELEPLGVMVVIRAEHGCMKIRGVEEPITTTTTSAVRGVFADAPEARNEFLSLMEDPR